MDTSSLNLMLKPTLLIVTGIMMAAETPKTPPPAAPKSAVLNETEQLKVENIQLRLQLTKATEAELNTALNGIFAKACQSIGGASMADCNAMGPTQGQPGYSVSLKPVKPVVAKAEEPKK